MLELEPPRHTRLRGLVLRAFTSRRIAALRPAIEALCTDLIDAFPPDPFDLLAAYARPLPVIVIARLLGVPEARADDLLAWSNAMVGMYQARRDRAAEDAAATAAAAFAAFLRAHLAARRAAPADDLLTHLLAAEAEGDRLTEDELVATVDPAPQRRPRGDRPHPRQRRPRHPAARRARMRSATTPTPWSRRCCAGTRRSTSSPATSTPRSRSPATASRPGDRVGCLLAAAGRDPAAYPDPHRFDPAPAAPGAPRLRRAASTSASARPSPGSSSASRSRRSSPAARRLALAEPPRYADVYHFHGLERLVVTR